MTLRLHVPRAWLCSTDVGTFLRLKYILYRIMDKQTVDCRCQQSRNTAIQLGKASGMATILKSRTSQYLQASLCKQRRQDQWNVPPTL